MILGIDVGGTKIDCAIFDDTLNAVDRRQIATVTHSYPEFIEAVAGLLAWADARTSERLRADAARLDTLLTRAGLRVVGGAPLFRLTESSDAARVFRRLGEAGVLVRPFPARPGWLRFGIPGEAKDWARLERALKCAALWL